MLKSISVLSLDQQCLPSVSRGTTCRAVWRFACCYASSGLFDGFRCGAFPKKTKQKTLHAVLQDCAKDVTERTGDAGFSCLLQVADASSCLSIFSNDPDVKAAGSILTYIFHRITFIYLQLKMAKFLEDDNLVTTFI